MIRAHKIRLRPTKEQERHLHRAFDAARNAWNFGKEILDCEYDINRILYRETGENYPYTSIEVNNKITGQRSIKALYNQVKPGWIKNVGTATQEAFVDLKRALRKYFDIRSGKITIQTDGKPRKDQRPDGWLNWRSKRDHNSFRAIYPKVEGPYIRYNAKVGAIRMCEELRFEGKVRNATFRYDGKWYWASVIVEMDDIKRVERDPVEHAVGLDLGIKYLGITSDGYYHPNPKAYYQKQARKRRLHRKLDRQRRANNPHCYNADGTAIKGKRPKNISSRMAQTDKQIKKIDDWVRNTRRNAQHHLTARLAQEYELIVLEDLNVRGMMKNSKLAKAIADAGFYEIRRQCEYKAAYTQVVSQWFGSSKMCSGCKEINFGLTLSDRHWTCDHCGQHNERDLNAAINLKNEGIRLFVNPDHK